MQMAMVLTAQKPTQRERIGEFSEGLPGSALERGMCREKRRELGRPAWFLKSLLARDVNSQWTEQVSQNRNISREAEGQRESDQLIVLRGRESRLHGEGADRST